MSDLVSYEDRMSEADALMWHIERDPLLRSTVTSVWVLDQGPDADRFDDTLAHAAAALPRLRQRAVPDRARLLRAGGGPCTASLSARAAPTCAT